MKLILTVSEITDAMNKINAIMSEEKVVAGVLFEFGNTNADVSCSNGRKAVTSKIDCELVSDYVPEKGKIIVDYESLLGVVNSCQPRGSIIVSKLALEVKESTVEFTIEKQIRTVKENEEVLQLGGVNKTEIAWKKPDSDMRTAILTRVDYNELYEHETCDLYTVGEMKQSLNRVINEKNKIVYLSAKQAKVFVANSAYMITIPLTDKQVSVVLSVANTKALVTAIARQKESDVLNVSVRDKFVKVSNEDKTFACLLEMGTPIDNNLIVLDRYNKLEYTTLQVDLYREMLIDTLNSISGATSGEKVRIVFSYQEDGPVIEFMAPKESNSVKGGYKVVCEGVLGEFDDAVYEIGIKTLLDMASKCVTDYIGFDLCVSAEQNVKALRVSEMDIEKRVIGTEEFRNANGIDISVVVETADKIKIREGSLVSKMYTLSN